MRKVSVTVNIDWKQIKADGSKCKNCQELLYSDGWQMIVSNTMSNESTPTVKICNSCKEMQDSQWN